MQLLWSTHLATGVLPVDMARRPSDKVSAIMGIPGNAANYAISVQAIVAALSLNAHCNIANLVSKAQNQIIQEKVPNRVIALHVPGVMPVVQASQINEPLMPLPRMASHVQPHVKVVCTSQHAVSNAVRH